MEALKPVWERLESVGSSTIFQSFAWNQLAVKCFAISQSPFVVMIERDSSSAIIPACIDSNNQRISLLGEELFDYRDALSAGDHTALAEAWQQVIELGREHR